MSTNGPNGGKSTATRPAANCTDCQALATVSAETEAEARETARNHATHTGHAVELETDGESETIQFATVTVGPDVEDTEVRRR